MNPYIPIYPPIIHNHPPVIEYVQKDYNITIHELNLKKPIFQIEVKAKNDIKKNITIYYKKQKFDLELDLKANQILKQPFISIDKDNPSIIPNSQWMKWRNQRTELLKNFKKALEERREQKS